MLINSYAHSIDAKGRVFIPARWREDLSQTVIVTRGMLGRQDSRCLFAMSLAAWNEFCARFKVLAVSDVRAQNAMRILFANACECELDKQGRILISNGLREYAGLDKDVVLIGMGERAEIWSATAWARHCEDNGDMSEDVLQYLSELGI